MISFLGVRRDRQTDRQGFVILTWKHVDTQKISTQNYWLAVDPYMPPRRTGMHSDMPLLSFTRSIRTNKK